MPLMNKSKPKDVKCDWLDLDRLRMPNNSVTIDTHYLACTLMNIKHIWMRSTGILHVYLRQ